MLRGVIIEKFVKILDPDDFFSQFKDDLREAKEEVIIFSPYVEPKSHRFSRLIEHIKDVIDRKVKVKLVVKKGVAEEKLRKLSDLGVELYGRETHVKAVLIDDKIIYIGSLNIFSYWEKEDIMVRISGILRRGIIPKIMSKKLFEKIKPPREEERIILQ